MRTARAAADDGGARTPRCGEDDAARDKTGATAQPATRDAATRSQRLAAE